MHEATFFKAPRYLLRKLNILDIVKKRGDIKNFLDVGCGAGELACSLAEEGLSGLGLDFSNDAIRTANNIKKNRHLTDQQVRFKKGTLTTLKKTYDLVIACEVLEHVEDDAGLLKSIVQTTNKYVLVSVPAKMKYFDEFDERVGHFRRYEKPELIELLEKAELEIEDFRSYGFPLINVTRLMRKVAASLVKKQTSMEESTKQSGINPIKLPHFIIKLNIENVMKPFYLISLPFNKFNLSEGYLVLAKRASKDT